MSRQLINLFAKIATDSEAMAEFMEKRSDMMREAGLTAEEIDAITRGDTAAVGALLGATITHVSHVDRGAFPGHVSHVVSLGVVSHIVNMGVVSHVVSQARAEGDFGAHGVATQPGVFAPAAYGMVSPVALVYVPMLLVPMPMIWAAPPVVPVSMASPSGGRGGASGPTTPGAPEERSAPGTPTH